MRTAITRALGALLIAVVVSAAARAGVYINEIYFDPPSSLDTTCEYIELRGTPNMSLADYYLIFLENEWSSAGSATATTGQIDHIFDLGANGSSAKLGSNGFLTMRQKSDPYAAPAPGTTDLVNMSTGYYSSGWGSGPDSTIGASQVGSTGVLENSGCTVMLIHNIGGAAPYLGQPMDKGNVNGTTPLPQGLAPLPTGWTVVDSIGITSEQGEAPTGRLYAQINFGPETTANIEPGAKYISTNFEIEHISRNGDSTGQTAQDWTASNLTNKAKAGFAGPADFRQSGSADPTGPNGGPWTFSANFHVESTHGVPYGTNMCNTLGASNLHILPGDANGDGTVNGADLNIVLSTYNRSSMAWDPDSGHPYTTTAMNWQYGDFDFDGTVNGSDLNVVLSNYNQSTHNAAAVPEPASWALAAVAALALAGFGRLRRTS
jgi:hypothetical protein